MARFNGFKIAGIDENKYPPFTDDNDMRDDLFYLALKLIGAHGNNQDKRLYCHRKLGPLPKPRL